MFFEYFVDFKIFNKIGAVGLFIWVSVLIEEFLIIVFLLLIRVWIRGENVFGFVIIVKVLVLVCCIIVFEWFKRVLVKKGVVGLLIFLKVLVKFKWIIFWGLFKYFIINCNCWLLLVLKVFLVICCLVFVRKVFIFFRDKVFWVFFFLGFVKKVFVCFWDMEKL